MFVKILIIIGLLAIVYSLGSAFFFMVRDKGQGSRTVRRLTWRVGLSLFLFLCLYAAYRMGWVEPSSNGPGHYSEPAKVEQPEQ